MKTKLLILLSSIAFSLYNPILVAQQVIEKVSLEGNLISKSYISNSEVVDSIVIQSPRWTKTWKEQQIRENEDCHLIGELVGTCAVLDLPIIGRIEMLDSNIALLFGGNRSEALRDRQIILMDLRTGNLLGWYGYITWKGNDVCKMYVDLENRTLLIGAKENQMLEDCIYVVDRNSMTIEPIHSESSPIKDLEISLIRDVSPYVSRNGLFRLRF